MKIGDRVKIIGCHYSYGTKTTAFVGDYGTIKAKCEEPTFDWNVNMGNSAPSFSESELELVELAPELNHGDRVEMTSSLATEPTVQTVVETQMTTTPETPPDNIHVDIRYGHPEFYKLLEQMAELHSRKNHDYAGTKDPLRNLKASERIAIDPFIGVMIRLQDKWSRLEQFLVAGEYKVKSESVEDTLMDNAVYSLLAIILYREKNGKDK